MAVLDSCLNVLGVVDLRSVEVLMGKAVQFGPNELDITEIGHVPAAAKRNQRSLHFPERCERHGRLLQKGFDVDDFRVSPLLYRVQKLNLSARRRTKMICHSYYHLHLLSCSGTKSNRDPCLGSTLPAELHGFSEPAVSCKAEVRVVRRTKLIAY